MIKLTSAERKKLNKKDKCVKCDKEGIYVIDAYPNEMYGVMKL